MNHSRSGPKRYAGRIARLEKRLAALADGHFADADATRLAKRLARHRQDLLTFLHKPDVPASNNHGERLIRPAVIIRKNSQSNRSDNGAAMQATFMSIYRTLRLRGLDPNKTIAAAPRTYLTSGQLPPIAQRPNCRWLMCYVLGMTACCDPGKLIAASVLSALAGGGDVELLAIFGDGAA